MRNSLWAASSLHSAKSTSGHLARVSLIAQSEERSRTRENSEKMEKTKAKTEALQRPLSHSVEILPSAMVGGATAIDSILKSPPWGLSVLVPASRKLAGASARLRAHVRSSPTPWTSIYVFYVKTARDVVTVLFIFAKY